MRLERLLPKHIHSDHNGFIQGQQGFHNIWRVMNIIYEKKETRYNTLISMDAEKAFDKIERLFLFEVLKNLLLETILFKGIQLIYSNGLLSALSRLYHGTRQWCPLSPLLFTRATVSLAMAIQIPKNISGIKLGNTDHHIDLYADDVILFCIKLNKSITSILSLINTFSVFSVYKINFNLNLEY